MSERNRTTRSRPLATRHSPLATGVIWDLDGVLVDSAAFHLESWQRLADEVGQRFTEADFWRTFGMRNPEIIAGVFGSHLGPEQVDALAERKEQLFRALARGRISPLPGAAELLRGLAERGFRQALATSTPRANVELILGELAVAHLFQAVVAAEDVRAGKPDPEVFLTAAQRLGVPPERCLVLEDAVAGAEAAAAGGMRCVVVAGKRAVDELSDQVPQQCQVVKSLEELSPLSPPF